MAEESAFRTSSPWLKCCQQANALIEADLGTGKLMPESIRVVILWTSRFHNNLARRVAGGSVN